MLVQDADVWPTRRRWQVVTQRSRRAEQLDDLRFAWSVVRHVKSNAIVLASERTVAGRRRRADEPRRLGRDRDRKAGDRAGGAALASDAFFPFADSIEKRPRRASPRSSSRAARKKDDEVIAACDGHGLAMVFTGRATSSTNSGSSFHSPHSWHSGPNST